MDVTTATPLEIDTKLGELYVARNTAEQVITGLADTMYRLAGDRGRYVSRNRKAYSISIETAEAKTREVAAGNSHEAESAQRAIKSLDKARAAVEAAEAASLPLENEFRSRPWSRFFLVTSSNGHIHSSMNCSTCKPTTTFGWLPQLSGKTEADAVADQGALLCTTCYPTAPVEWTNGRDAKVDDKQCPGSGTLDYPRETARLGYAAGNYGVCRHCNQPITVTSTRKLRKHNKA